MPVSPSDLRAVMDESAEGILIVDRHWRMTYVNATALRLLYGDSDRVPSMVQAKPLWEDPPILGSSRLFKKQIDAMEHDQPAEFDEYFPALDQWLRVSITPNPGGFVTVLRDISAIRRAEDMCQQTRSNFKHIRRLYMPEDAKAGRAEHNLQKARLCGATTDEWWRCRKDGTPFWASVTITAMYDGEGKLQGYAKILKDLTERKGIEERQQFLASAGTVLSASLDAEYNLRKLTRFLVPAFATWCVIHCMNSGRTGQVLVMHHESPEKQQFLEELDRLYPDFLELAGGPRKAMRTGQPVLVSQVDTSLLATFARDERHALLLQELGIDKYVSVPLAARGKTMGALTLVSAQAV